MDRFRNMKMKGMKNEDIFSVFTEYVRNTIEKDLKRIYEEETRFIDSDEPWIFQAGS